MVRVLANGDLCCEINLSTTSYNSINLSCKSINNVLSPSLVSIDLSTHVKNGDLLLEVIDSHNNNEKAHKSLFDKKANELDLSTVAKTGDYSDLINRPTIPTVNNATITITQGGTTKGTFTLNQLTDETIDIEDVDIDEIVSDLNGKADIDLFNVNATGTSTGANWAMPSGTYDSLTLGASGSTYTAPANGYYTLYAIYVSGTQTAVSLKNQNNNIGASHTWYYSYSSALLSVPCAKGQTVIFECNGTLGNIDFRFVYAKGSESEAS